MKRFDTFRFVDLKKLKKRYRSLTVAVSVPFFQFVLIIVLLLKFTSESSSVTGFDILAMDLIYIGTALFLSIVIIGIIISKHFLKVHKMNTFIDISSRVLIISRHGQTYLDKFKKKYYKRLYIINLSELESINLVKRKIVIKGKIRILYEKSDWLLYSFTDKGILFDKWWFDNNAGKIVNSVEIPNYFQDAPRLIKLVRRVCRIEKDRIVRHKKYHEQMLELAKNSTLNKTKSNKNSNSKRR